MTDVARPLDDDDLDRRWMEAPTLFQPPPGIYPNNAVFSTANLPKPLTWQHRGHAAQRRDVLGRIGQLLRRNAERVVVNGAGPGPQAVTEAHMKTWALARKLEVLMFISSASLMEYCNVDSLARRVQALTTSIVNKKIRKEIVTLPPAAAAAASAPHQAMAASASRPAPLRRPGICAPEPVMKPPAVYAAPTTPVMAMSLPATGMDSPSLPSIGFLMHKKRSVEEMQQAEAVAETAVGFSRRVRPRSGRLGQLLFRGYEELSKIIWSYVDGTQIMRSRAVCRGARKLAPLFVTSLQLSCNAVQIALATKSADSNISVLRECVNLQQLEIVSLSSSGMNFGKLSMRATNCPQRFVVTHDDHEQIVLALSEVLRCFTFPRLTRLGLICLFTNEEADGEAEVLLNNLMSSCCPQLEELCLPGNSVGDYGAAKVTQLLRSRVCPKLTRLDLRRNFIGEEGLRSLCHALADGCATQLTELCLGGNTITDSSFHHLLYAMESGQLRHLRFLGIEMNYLSATSMEMLGRTIGKLVCPKLSQISYSDNSVDNADAKRLIATAVHQERMRLANRQRMLRQGKLVEDEDSGHSSDDDYSSDEETTNVVI